VAGFIAIPAFGLRSSLLLATSSLLLGAFALIVRTGTSVRSRLAALLPIGAVVALMFISPAWDREWLAAGGYLYTRFVPPGVDRHVALTAGHLLYYREGPTGTVSVKEVTGNRSLSIDGKVDASTGRDMLTQKMLAHLPLLLHPNPARVGIVGLGSGVTVASALAHPISAVDVIEISPEVIEASAHFADVNRRALDEGRTQLIRGDGRTHLSLTSRRYDVVISEPSNPWMAGVAALFTQDFFRSVRERLTPGGIFCQWAHTYDVSDDDLRSIVATFRSVFPDATMWLVGDGDLLLVGSTSSGEPGFEGLSAAWQRPGVAEDLRSVGVAHPFALLSLYAGGPDEMSSYGAGAIVQTDDRTPLEFSGPVAIFDAHAAGHATATLRTLLQREKLPATIALAFTDAAASQWRERGAMLMAAEAFDAAYGDYVKALELAPTDQATLDGLVRAAVAADRQDDAERRLRELVQSRNGESAPQIALARLLGMRGRFDEAISVAMQATSRTAADASAWEQLASLQADRGDAGGLEATATALRDRFPTRPEGWYFAASAGFLRGDVGSALPFVHRAIELDVNYADAYNLLGAIRGTMGEIDAARDAFRTSLRLDPRDSVTYVNLAQLELAAGERAAAADLLAEALSLDPNSAAAREGLAQTTAPRN
jgi:spermidine synthase